MNEKEFLNSIENPDNQLAAEAQAGDLLAEEKLIRKYTSIVSRRARAYFIVGADSDDVIQEGMIGLMKAVRSFDASKNASFATFAEKCITNQIISAIRSADRAKNKILNESLSLNVPVASAAGASAGASGDSDGSGDGTTIADMQKDIKYSPEQVLIMSDVSSYIVENDENVFSSFEMEVLSKTITGYSYEQIAEKLGKTPKAVDNALQRVKKKINEYLWK